MFSGFKSNLIKIKNSVMKKVLLNFVILFTVLFVFSSCNKKDCYIEPVQNNIFVSYTAAVYVNNNVYVPSGYSLIGMYSITNTIYPMNVRIQSVFIYGGLCNMAYSTDGTSWYSVNLNGNSFTINTVYNQIYFARSLYGNSGYIYISSVNNYSVNQVNAGF